EQEMQDSGAYVESRGQLCVLCRLLVAVRFCRCLHRRVLRRTSGVSSALSSHRENPGDLVTERAEIKRSAHTVDSAGRALPLELIVPVATDEYGLVCSINRNEVDRQPWGNAEVRGDHEAISMRVQQSPGFVRRIGDGEAGVSRRIDRLGHERTRMRVRGY